MLDVAPSPSLVDPRLDRVFPVIVFDWDGTAVPDRLADTRRLGMAMNRLLRMGARLAIVTVARFAQIDRALAGHIRGTHITRLLVSTNRGSELYGYDASGEPLLLLRRPASAEEDAALDLASTRLAEEVRSGTGLDVAVRPYRLNRRKVDLFPSWSDPPKARLAELVPAVEARLAAAGWRGGVPEVVRRALAQAKAAGLADPRVSSDGKQVEIGLTDESDAILDVLGWLDERADALLLVGDEVGTVGGVPGSDARLRTDRTADAVLVSVGLEPAGVPEGVIHLGGGPDRFAELLEAQAERRVLAGADVSAAPPPSVTPTDNPVRELVELGLNLVREHEVESRFTVGNGAVGVRGSLSEGTALSSPATRLAGCWVPGIEGIPTVALAPEWTGLRVRVGDDEITLVDDGAEHRRVLDMAQGIYWRTWRHEGEDGRITQLRVARFASMADRRVLAERVEITTDNWSGDLEIEATVRTPTYWWRTGPATWVGPAHATMALELRGESPDTDSEEEPLEPSHAERDQTDQEPPIPPVEIAPPPPPTPTRERPATSESASTLARWRVVSRSGMVWRLDRIVTVGRGPDLSENFAQEVLATGVDRAAHEHSVACHTRVDALTVTLEGDAPLQQALSFATHHLVAAANPEDERTSIGARALTGPVYMGHVFWDTEIWLLPVYILTWPRAARAMAMYRWHTLPAARERARRKGYRGALFAWESTDTGADVTPPIVVLPDGLVAPVLTGDMEHHISADVAWAAWHYWTWSGDDAYLQEAGAEVMLETARFWASRGAMEDDGRFHIRHVIGPDEYHEDVDDNAYTNGMAAWNLQRGAEVARVMSHRWPELWNELSTRLGLEPEEIGTWEQRAASIHVGWDPNTGLIEQFTGYFALEDIDLRALEPRTLPVDMLLGSPRVRNSQLVKQADVVLLLQLLGDRFPPEVHEANFRYYEARTAHGSSLSPSVHALAAARLGQFDTAERYLRQTAAIDLQDGNAAGGVHIGAQGGLWQAVAFGYAGLHLTANGPALSPRMPGWLRRLSFPFVWRERRYTVVVDQTGGRIVPEVSP